MNALTIPLLISLTLLPTQEAKQTQKTSPPALQFTGASTEV